MLTGKKALPTLDGTGRKPQRRLTGAIVLAFLLALVLIQILALGPGKRIVTGIIMDWAEEQGIALSVADVSISGWSRLILHNIEAEVPIEDGVGGVRAKSVVVAFDTLAWFQGSRGAALITDIMVEDGDYTIETLDLKAAGTLNLHGFLSDDGVDVRSFALAIETPTFRGKVHGQGTITLNESGALEGTLNGKALQVHVAGDEYRLDAVRASVRYADGLWELVSVTGRRGEAGIELFGVVGGSPVVDLTVEATQLDLGKDLPILARYGFAGPGDFSGHLRGDIGHLVLDGKAAVGPGMIWGRPNVTGTGRITLSGEGFVLTDVDLKQYGGNFVLQGEYSFARSERPAALDLTLRSESGRVQELLAVLGWDLPVSGRLYGDISFAGEVSAIKAEGEIEILEAVAWEQPLDRVAGAFTWNDGLVTIADVEASLAMGKAFVDGTYDVVQDHGRMGFSVSNWPLGFTTIFEEHLGQHVGGTVEIHEGLLSGSLSAPQVCGRLVAEALRVGPTLFRTVEGSVAYQDGDVYFSDMRGQRAGGGMYALNGTIAFAGGDQSDTQLHLAIAGERLRSLLQLAQGELPALFIDGTVSGDVKITGSLKAPTADLDLVVQETLALRKGIRIAMHFADGALRIRDLDLSVAES